MGMPAIAPYPLPTELPDNVVDWTVDPDRAVLLIHDMQRYFVRPFHDELGVPLVDNVAGVLDRCRATGVPVVYTAQPGGMTVEQRGLLKDFWGPGMTVEPSDREIVEPLTPRQGDRVYTKWRYSAFFASDLLADLRALGRDQLVLCGVYAHVGVLMTAVDAFSHDVQPFLVADATADFTAEHHRLALDYAASNCAVVCTAKEVLP
jgi:trans-2,3-dihydro-3-hydroxyanthranilic acid synthase